MLTPQQIAAYQRDGFVLVRGLWTLDEVQAVLDRAMELNRRVAIPGCFSAEPDAADPLARFPRMMHPHRVDDLCLRMLRHAPTVAAMEQLMGQPAIGAQTMIYFKPPGARGQDFHQDNYYLKSEPIPCAASWTALERIDSQNGGMSVIPGSHRRGLLPMAPTDRTRSFTPDAAPVPAGMSPVLIEMAPGDVLFFDGLLIHGSPPNESGDRWRRVFICHYLPAAHTAYNHGYDPLVPLH